MLTFLASAAAANLASRLASLVRLFLSKVSGTAICYKVFLSVSYFYFLPENNVGHRDRVIIE